jgi:hypothetical protein
MKIYRFIFISVLTGFLINSFVAIAYGLTLTKVYELANGIITHDDLARDKVAFAFPYIPVYKVDSDGAIDLYTLDEKGAVVHRFNPTLSDDVALFPSKSGDVLAMIGYPGFNPPNVEPVTKKVFSREGEQIYEGKYRGFPRLMSDGDYLVIFITGQKPPPHVVIPVRQEYVTIVNLGTGQTLGIDTSVAYVHGVSEGEGDALIAVPEYIGFFEGRTGGTKIYDAGGNLKFTLDPGFLCDGAGANIRGKVLYLSGKYIVQAGYKVQERKEVVEDHEGKETIFYVAECGRGRDRENGVQVYDGDGRLLWEEYLGKGRGDLQIVVSPNAEYVAVYTGPRAGINVYSLSDGRERWEFNGNIDGLYFSGDLSDDGRVLAVSTFDYADRVSEIYVIDEGRLASHMEIPSERNLRAEGIVDPAASYLLVNDDNGGVVYKVTGGE